MPGSAADQSSLRIGLFGGTFDPPHIGHLVVADQVKEALALDEVVFMVANAPWQKNGSRKITPPDKRVALATRAILDSPGFSVSDLELHLGGNSYTINTVEALVAGYRAEGIDVEILIIVGADTAAGLDTWHRAEALRQVAEFVVVNRPGDHSEPPLGWKTQHVGIPPLDISGTQIRTAVKTGRSIRYLVPDPVIDQIKRFGLYLD